VLSPVLDLLGVTHVIFRRTPPPGVRPVFQSPDYWVMENSSALSRVFVPRRVEAGGNDEIIIQKLADPEFDPRQSLTSKPRLTFPAIAGERRD